MKQLLSVTGLSVRRSQAFRLAIDQLDVPAGALLCVAGPNGSGKTTLIECLTGLLVPDTGSIMLDRIPMTNNLRAAKARLGFVPDDELWCIKELCAKEYFALLVEVYREAGVQTNMPARIAELATALYFTNFLQPLEQLSHGNKKKVQLIAGLMHQPQVIILDEMRNGLDPLAVIAAEELVRAEAKRGACIVAATHDLWWAQRVADDILLLIDGVPALHQKTRTIVRQHGSVEAAFLATVQQKHHAATP